MMYLETAFSVPGAAMLVSLVAVVELLLLWRILRAARAWRHVEERVAQFGKVLTLLTETTETGFEAVATELRRRVEAEPARAASAPTRRVITTGARRGRSVGEVAVQGRMAEGEVSLRSYLDSRGRGHALACPCASCAARASTADASM